MSVNKEKNGTYTVRWYETNSSTGEAIQRKKRGFATKREARAFEDKMNDLKVYASIAQLKDQYIASLQGYASAETMKDKRSMANRYLEPLYGFNVRDIKKTDIVAWRNQIAVLDRSTCLKNKILQLLKSISRFGSDIYGYPNFAGFLKPFPKTSDDVKTIMVISPEDFDKAMENINMEIYRRFYTFLYHTGMRRGEAQALQKNSVVWVNGKEYVKIEKSVDERSYELKTLKNPQSKRTILLDDVARETIEPLLATDGDFLFGGESSLRHTNITRHFNKGLDGAGLPHYRIHDLRHSFISNAILNGVDIVSVSKYVGHKNIERTLNTYSHLLKDSEARMIDQLNSLFKK